MVSWVGGQLARWQDICGRGSGCREAECVSGSGGEAEKGGVRSLTWVGAAAGLRWRRLRWKIAESVRKV